jgi:hypothetical protein
MFPHHLADEPQPDPTRVLPQPELQSERGPNRRFSLRVALGMAATFALWAALVRPSGSDGLPVVVHWALQFEPGLQSISLLVMIAVVFLLGLPAAVYCLVEPVVLVVLRPGCLWLWCRAILSVVLLPAMWFVLDGMLWSRGWFQNALVGTWALAAPLAIVECWLRRRPTPEMGLAIVAIVCVAIFVAMMAIIRVQVH